MSQDLTYTAGSIIFRQGYPSDMAYVIISGKVEIYREHLDGTVEHVAMLEEGQMFGELGVLDDAPRSASAKAATDVVLQRMPL